MDLTVCLVGDVEVGAEQIDDLIVLLALDCFLKRHEIRPEFAKAVDNNRPGARPTPRAPTG
jgi:hypothetical protein